MSARGYRLLRCCVYPAGVSKMAGSWAAYVTLTASIMVRFPEVARSNTPSSV
jgi:hypothetical protein